MGIEIIDTLSQKNNGSFPLVDSNDIRGGFYQVDSIEERDLIPSVRRKEGMFCAVKNDELYQLVGGIENVNWVVFSSSDFDGDYNSLINKPVIPVVDVDKAYVDEKFSSIVATSIHVVDTDGNYQSSDVEGCLREISDILNKKVDDIILTDDNYLNFYSNNVLIKSIKIEGASQGGVGSSEIEQLKNTKIDDISVDTRDGITYIKLFANDILLKSIELQTSGESLIHVGADEPTADNCEVWIDVSDDEEYIGKLPDLMLNEIKTIINNLQSEILSLKQKIVEHETRILYLEVNGGGNSGGSVDKDYIALTLETGEVLTLETGEILTFEGSNSVGSKHTYLTFEDNTILTLEDSTMLTFEN